MRIIKEEDKIYSINTKEIKLNDMINLNNKISKQILELLNKQEMYPKQIAKKLNIHEQNIYYYIRKFEKANIIHITKRENINGTFANFYSLTSESFFFKLDEFKQTSKIFQKDSSYLNPFIVNSKLNSIIIVGSPDPHGPQKARSKDGYFGIDLALFLGSYIDSIENLNVRLDTEITQKELLENNLVIIGGPIVNKITSIINKNMQIYFDEKIKGIYSKITKKIYFNEEIGIINKFTSPFNKDKSILFIGGIRNSGTKSAIIAFIKHFKKLERGNIFKDKNFNRVVEGIDLNSDGQIDDCDFLE